MTSATLPQLPGYRKQPDLQIGVSKYVLNTNPNRTKIMRINNTRKENVTLSRRATDKREKLFYIRFVVTKKRETQQDTKNHISKAHLPVNQLFSIHTTKLLPLISKSHLSETNVKAVLISGCKTWKGTKNTENHLQVYISTWYLSEILNTKSPNAINKWTTTEYHWTNNNIWQTKKKARTDLAIYLSNYMKQ